MIQTIKEFFNSENFMPHGHCFLWYPEVMWLHVISDIGIVTAYFGIPFALVYLMRKRADLPFDAIFMLFAAFILLCGLTHAMSIWVLWYPDYAIEGVLKALTAAVSISTLIVLIKLIPKILRIPNISQLTLANQEIERSRQELEILYKQNKANSESYLQAVMNTMLDGLITLDENRIIQSMNPAVVRIFGYQPEEIIGQNLDVLMLDPLHTEDKLLEKVLGIREVSGKHKDGTVFPLELGITEMQIDGARMFVGMVHDIRERKEVERIKSEFVSIISHELRTPLTSIRGSLGLILGAMQKELPANTSRLIEIAHKNSERLILLINGILDIDKITSGQMQFDFTNEALAPLMQHAVETNLPYAQNLGVSITVSPIDPNLTLQLDKARFLQVMANLISNAAKFSLKEGIIEISALSNATHVRVMVRDFGLGIQEEFRSRVFEKFSQADSSVTRYKGGTGLGLHISKKIVESMGGKIGFDTEVGKGTTFWIELPISQNQQSSITSSDEIEPIVYPKKLQSVIPNVLSIEDDKDLSSVLATALSGKVEVITATTLKHAELLLKEHQFNMIILDIGMPDGSGLNLLERLPELTESIPLVVILAASEAPRDIQKKVAASMVKSRISETKVVEKILQLLNPHT